MGRLWIVLSVLGLLVRADVAEACGGFFCGRTPVDQTAERIVFRVNEDTTTMIVQIAYTGKAQDFAWVLPVGTVPDIESLDVFPQRALTAFDTNTGPMFNLPADCLQFATLDGSCPGCASAAPDPIDEELADVNVHFRAEVGPYDVAAIESEDPMALYDWLRDNDFNVNEVMLPYIESYTKEGMKFIALKLQPDADSSDIQPFQFDLQGTSPSVPLRMTAVAAEPEMSIVVSILGEERYNGANWPEVEIRDEQIAWRQNTWPLTTNWAALVAKGVDVAGGQGWVTEFAGSTAPLISLLENSGFNTPEDEEAGMALLDLMGSAPYVTRLYTRVSAEEMSSDPIFRRDAGGDVVRNHMLSRVVDGVDQCPDMPGSPDPCLFTSCGAGGICRPVQIDGMDAPVAGCGCVSGATARTTFDPASGGLQTDGSSQAAIICQDARMSFVNPGDTAPSGATIEDPCTGFDCGANGECLAMNMTPTCVCDEGYVAIGSYLQSGARATSCEQPMEPVPMAFYGQRLPDLPEELPGGRVMAMVDTMLPVVEPSMDDLGSTGMPLPRNMSGGDGALDDEPVAESGTAGAGQLSGPSVPDEGSPTGSNPGESPAPSDDDSSMFCSVRAPGAGGGPGAALLLGLLGLGWLRRRAA